MNNEEINRYCHVDIMGKRESKPESCPICNVIHEDARQRFENAGGSYPDYCSDDSPRRLLNEVVASIWDVTREGMLLRFQLMKLLDGVGIRPDTQNEEIVALRATAEQIARAAVEAHKAANPAA